MAASPVTENADGSISVCFDARVCPLDAIKKAAYKFAKDCSVILGADGDNYLATISFFDAATEPSAKKRLVGAFCNEVIDQELREKIATQTEPVRNLILAQAFSKTSLISDD
jgi:His-Xaa-Ser system protein HxsD